MTTYVAFDAAEAKEKGLTEEKLSQLLDEKE